VETKECLAGKVNKIHQNKELNGRDDDITEEMEWESDTAIERSSDSESFQVRYVSK